MSLFMVDVEADGPAPGIYSMVSFGVVKVKEGPLDVYFYGKTAPISELYIPDALAVSGFTRKEHESFEKADYTLNSFNDWLVENSDGRPRFISDNPAFDWQFINYYFWKFIGKNPFGHSAQRVGDFYAGLMKDTRATSKWKSLRKTKHTHHPVDDAIGNVEALIAMCKMHRVQGFRLDP